MNVEIANKLVKLRKSHGLSQGDLADKIGVSRQAVSKWECAESSPDTDNLIALSKLYEITIDELIVGDTEILNQDTQENVSPGRVLQKRKVGSLIVVVISLVVVGFLVYFAVVAMGLL